MGFENIVTTPTANIQVFEKYVLILKAID